MFTLSVEEVRIIKENASKAEWKGELTEEQLKIIYKHGLFKIFLPEDLGGLNLSMPEAAEVFRKCSAADGSFGWLVTIGAGGNYFYNCMEKNVAENIFSGKKAVIAGSGAPTGKAKPVPDGFIINGKWKYCSGANFATTFTMNCFILDQQGKNTGNVRSFILRPNQVKIHEDWNAIGMKATASHSIEVNDAFIPADHTFAIFQPKNISDALIFLYPFLEFARVSFAALILGLGEAFVEESIKIAEGNKYAWAQPFEKRFSKVRKVIAENEQKLQHVQSQFAAIVHNSWQELEKQSVISETTARAVSKNCFETTNAVLDILNDIYPYLGMSALFPDNKINRIWRDLNTDAQHILVRDLE